MATINLLPWREERREELKKEFAVVIAVFAGIAVLIVLGWQTVLNSQLEHQEYRNKLLSRNIAELNDQVKEISSLQDKRQALISRMEVIQRLQGDRPAIVHIFDEIVRTLPDGVYYRKIDRRGSTMTFSGTAESNNRVSSLMRQLDASPWFASPNLKVVSANPKFGEQANNFELVVKITTPEIIEE